jgi:hypothetical protein
MEEEVKVFEEFGKVLIQQRTSLIEAAQKSWEDFVDSLVHQRQQLFW